MAVISTNDAWAVGNDDIGNGVPETLTEHWNGSNWSVVSSPSPGTLTNVLSGVAAVSTSDVWAVGTYYLGGITQSLIEHWNGMQWSVIANPNPGPTSNGLNAVVAVSTSDVWAVGYYANAQGIYQTMIEQWKGTKWSVVTRPSLGQN